MTEKIARIQAIQWTDEGVRLLDQRLLPFEEKYLLARSSTEVAAAIRDMQVRGAPAIGIAAAYGVVLSARAHLQKADWWELVQADMNELGQARPTAVNLDWALVRMAKVVELAPERVGDELLAALLAEAEMIHQADISANLHMAEAGAALLPDGVRVLTHCNTGALATGGHGTALGVIRTAWAQKKLAHVYADETRPWLQGSRLTAWELQSEGIPATLLCDGAAASLMQQGMVDWVIVGADRIVANGDVANKIGTYSLAVLARQHGVKFMVVAPTSTVDMSIGKGADIPIEHRPADEILCINDNEAGLTDIAGWNPVFDITPAELIDCIVTEISTVEQPDKQKMRAAFR